MRVTTLLRTAFLIASALGFQAARVEFAISADSLSTTVGPAWSSEQVSGWAAAHSPAARILESERSAVGCGLNRDDESQRAQVALIQSVYRELAQHQREKSAADAQRVYFQAVATREKKVLLRQSAPLIATLESMANKARELNIPDGDIDLLADQTLLLEDRWYQADIGYLRLQNQLIELAGQRTAYSDPPVLVTPLPSSAAPLQTVDHYSQLALLHRNDLAAVETLCRCMNSKSLPAARNVLGSLSPGAGLLAMAAPLHGLKALHRPDESTADLACRKMQCQELAEAQRMQIHAEVRDAWLKHEEATLRLDVAMRRLQAKQSAIESAKRNVELEQTAPGTDVKLQLEASDLQANLIDRQLDLALAIVTLHEATGSPAIGSKE